MGENRPFFLTLAFMLYFKKKDFKKCYIVLEEYKDIPGPNIRGNYSFMKSLLDHIASDAPLYVYASNYKDFPELHNQLEVIKNLASGDNETAKKFWGMLAKHNPNLYQEDFTYQGDEGLFSVALKKHFKISHGEEFNPERLKEIPLLSEKIHYVLTHKSSPVSRSEMIHLLWGEEETPENSGRLQKQISRYKNQFNIQVHCYQGTYFLKKKSAKPAKQLK
jgi:hypothetical protein